MDGAGKDDTCGVNVERGAEGYVWGEGTEEGVGDKVLLEWVGLGSPSFIYLFLNCKTQLTRASCPRGQLVATAFYFHFFKKLFDRLIYLHNEF